MISAAVDLQNFTAGFYATTAAVTLGERFEMRSPVKRGPGDPLADWLPEGTYHFLMEEEEGRGKRKREEEEVRITFHTRLPHSNYWLFRY